MARYHRNLLDRKTGFEQSTGRFVAQIVKAQIVDIDIIATVAIDFAFIRAILLHPAAVHGVELDQFLAGNVFEFYAPERNFERLKDHGLRAPNWLANLSEIVEMQRNQI